MLASEPAPDLRDFLRTTLFSPTNEPRLWVGRLRGGLEQLPGPAQPADRRRRRHRRTARPATRPARRVRGAHRARCRTHEGGSVSLAILRAAFLLLLRDRGALLMALVVPVVFFLIFAEIFATAAGDQLQLRIAIVDEVQSEDSIRLLKALTDVPAVRPVPGTADPGVGPGPGAPGHGRRGPDHPRRRRGTGHGQRPGGTAAAAAGGPVPERHGHRARRPVAAGLLHRPPRPGRGPGGGAHRHRVHRVHAGAAGGDRRRARRPAGIGGRRRRQPPRRLDLRRPARAGQRGRAERGAEQRGLLRRRRRLHVPAVRRRPERARHPRRPGGRHPRPDRRGPRRHRRRHQRPLPVPGRCRD